MKKPTRRKPITLRAVGPRSDRVRFECPDCCTVHSFKLLSPFECLSLSDEDTYRIETSPVASVLHPVFICTRHTCNFEAVLHLQLEQ